VQASVVHPCFAAGGGGGDRQRLAEAEVACLQGDSRRGVELLAQLYLTSRHPAYLHNQARCYEQNGQYGLAAARYQEFLAKVHELPAARWAAEGFSKEKIAAIELRKVDVERLAAAAARTPAATSEIGKDARHPTDPPAAPAASPGTLVLTQQAAPAPRRWGPGVRLAGTTTMAAGGVTLVGGVIAALTAKQAEREISDASANRRTFDAERYRAGEQAATISTVAFIATPVLVGLGALLYWNGSAPPAAGARASVSVVPTISRSSVGGLVAIGY
jgi:hypothetical protein